MSQTNSFFSESYPCAECRAGILQPRHVTYYTWLGNELISVPHFPAWVCDVCGRREYDSKAILWLNMILDPNAGKPTAKRRHTQPLPRPQTGMSRPLRDS
jgi:YgiT-type zinc finger domain-containing protein